MLEDEKGVLAALPFCDSGRVEVWAEKGTLTEKKAKEIIHFDKDFKVIAFATKAPAKAKAKAKGKAKGQDRVEGGEKKTRKKGRRRNRRNRKKGN